MRLKFENFELPSYVKLLCSTAIIKQTKKEGFSIMLP